MLCKNFPVLLGTEVQQQLPTPFTPHLPFQSSALTANWINKSMHKRLNLV